MDQSPLQTFKFRVAVHLPLHPRHDSRRRAPSILVADDQPDLVEALRLLLKTDGFQMEAVSSPDAALRAIERGAFDLLLMDLNYSSCTTSGREGLDLLSRIRATNGSLGSS